MPQTIIRVEVRSARELARVPEGLILHTRDERPVRSRRANGVRCWLIQGDPTPRLGEEAIAAFGVLHYERAATPGDIPRRAPEGASEYTANGAEMADIPLLRDLLSSD